MSLLPPMAGNGKFIPIKMLMTGGCVYGIVLPTLYVYIYIIIYICILTNTYIYIYTERESMIYRHSISQNWLKGTFTSPVKAMMILRPCSQATATGGRGCGLLWRRCYGNIHGETNGNRWNMMEIRLY